jgi:hypothetical protein
VGNGFVTHTNPNAAISAIPTQSSSNLPRKNPNAANCYSNSIIQRIPNPNAAIKCYFNSIIQQPASEKQLKGGVTTP